VAGDAGTIRLAELTGAIARTVDVGIGFPPETAVRLCLLGSSVDHTAFEQKDYAATGDHVYATVRLVQTIRATGRTLEQPELIHHFTFRNGKVVRCRVAEDTALTAAAFAT